MTSIGIIALLQRLKRLTANTLSKVSLLLGHAMEVGIRTLTGEILNSHYGGRSILGQLLSLLSLNDLNLTMILNSVQPLISKALFLSPPGMSL